MKISLEKWESIPALTLTVERDPRQDPLIFSPSPHQDTRNIQFARCFTRWMQSVMEATQGDVIAINSKTLQRSYDAAGQSAIHRVSAWSGANGVLLGQEKQRKKVMKLLPYRNC